MEWVGLRFGLRQLSYQHCFRVGQPASLCSTPLSTLHPPLPAPVLHYLVASSLCLPCPTCPNLPFFSLIPLLFSLGLTLFFLPTISPPVFPSAVCVWGMTLRPGLSILAPRPQSLLTAPTLLELESEDVHFCSSAKKKTPKKLQGQLYDFFYL